MVTLVNRAKVITNTTGTGALTLGSAVDGFQTFAAAGVTDGQTVRYVIENGTAWEIGSGTYTASGTTLSRSASESSDGGAEITLAGTSVVYVIAGAQDILQEDDLTAGTGISIAGATITNTAPDQTVSLTQGANVTITGTYPSFTIAATDTNTTYSAGTGLSLTGTVFANTAPDQTVALSNGTGISVTGTYPNFTVTNTAPDQTVSLTQGANVTITGSYPSFTIAATDTNTTYSAGTGLGLSGTTFNIDSTVATLTGSQTLTNKTLTTPAITRPTLTGTPTEDVYAISGTSVALEPDNGSVQTHTLSGNTTYSDGFSAGQAITLMIDDGSSRTVTWPTMTWVNNAGAAPTLATSGYTTVALWKVSTTLYGALVGDGT